MRKFVLFCLLAVLLAVPAGAQSSSATLRDALARLDGFQNRALAATGAVHLPEAPSEIHAYLEYARDKASQDAGLVDALTTIYGERAAFLAGVPEGEPEASQLAANDRDMLAHVQQALQIEQGQVVWATQAVQAHDSNDVATWNALMGEQDQHLADYDAVETECKNLVASGNSLTQKVRDRLAAALVVAETPPVAPPPAAPSVKPEALRKKLAELAKDKKFKANGATTHCSEFVRADVRGLGLTAPELDGRVADQVRAMSQKGSRWDSLVHGTTDKDLAAAFAEASRLAGEGRVVVVAWVNPKPTSTDSGHIALVVPSKEMATAGVKTNSGKPGWGTYAPQVPFVAQAGRKSVDASVSLTQAFPPTAHGALKVFVLNR